MIDQQYNQRREGIMQQYQGSGPINWTMISRLIPMTNLNNLSSDCYVVNRGTTIAKIAIDTNTDKKTITLAAPVHIRVNEMFLL